MCCKLNIRFAFVLAMQICVIASNVFFSVSMCDEMACMSYFQFSDLIHAHSTYTNQQVSQHRGRNFQKLVGRMDANALASFSYYIVQFKHTLSLNGRKIHWNSPSLSHTHTYSRFINYSWDWTKFKTIRWTYWITGRKISWKRKCARKRNVSLLPKTTSYGNEYGIYVFRAVSQPLPERG